MPDVCEKFASETRSSAAGQGSRELTYLAIGYATSELAEAAVLAYAPTTFELMPIVSADTSEIADSIYECTLVWSFQLERPEEGDETLSFSTTGGTQRITQSRGTTSYAASGTAPDFKGAIGVTKDSVEGVDIIAPSFSFQKSRTFPSYYVTNAYVKALSDATGTINSAAFMGFASQEVLFVGAEGRQKSPDEPWTITFHFKSGPNLTGLSVGTITGIAKKAWQYLWVLYQDTEDTTAKFLTKRPIAAYVEDVYRQSNFSTLGVNTT
jgi:hypothetical protein